MENTRTSNGTSELIVTAIESEFRSQRDKAIAQLSIYINSHVGVADHPHIIDECTTLVKTIAEAEDGLRVLRGLLVPAPAPNQS